MNYSLEELPAHYSASTFLWFQDPRGTDLEPILKISLADKSFQSYEDSGLTQVVNYLCFIW